MLSRRQLAAAGFVTSVSVFALAGCSTVTVGKLRYRLTVEVETPEGLMSGYSVIQVRATEVDNAIKMPHASTGGIDYKGEAVVVELPGGRVLFALLKNRGGAERGGRFPKDAFRDRVPFVGNAALDNRAAVYQRIAQFKGQTEKLGQPDPDPRPYKPAANDSLPFFITFTDLDNSLTMREVDPDNFAGTFGAGYAFKQATVTITDERVTTGKILPYYERLGLEKKVSLNPGDKSDEKGFRPTDNDFGPNQPSLPQTIGRDFFVTREVNWVQVYSTPILVWSSMIAAIWFRLTNRRRRRDT